MEMQINVNTKIIYMDSAVPVMRAIENVKRDIRKVCCDSDEKGCDIVLIMENMQAEQFEIKCDNNMLVIYASDTLGFVWRTFRYVSVIAVTNYHILHHIPEISGRWNRDGWY